MILKYLPSIHSLRSELEARLAILVNMDLVWLLYFDDVVVNKL